MKTKEGCMFVIYFIKGVLTNRIYIPHLLVPHENIKHKNNRPFAPLSTVPKNPNLTKKKTRPYQMLGLEPPRTKLVVHAIVVCQFAIALNEEHEYIG